MTDTERNVLVGNRIKQARLAKNMTLDEVAEEVQVAKSTIQRYETAKIQSLKMPVLEAIAKVLNVNPVWLIGESVPMERQKSDEAYGFEAFAVEYNNKRHERIISMSLKDSELKMIEKYRFLDDYGKAAVDGIIDTEYARCKDDEQNTMTLTQEEIRSLPLEQRLKMEKYVDADGSLKVARKRTK